MLLLFLFFDIFIAYDYRVSLLSFGLFSDVLFIMLLSFHSEYDAATHISDLLR